VGHGEYGGPVHDAAPREGNNIHSGEHAALGKSQCRLNRTEHEFEQQRLDVGEHNVLGEFLHGSPEVVTVNDRRGERSGELVGNASELVFERLLRLADHHVNGFRRHLHRAVEALEFVVEHLDHEREFRELVFQPLQRGPVLLHADRSAFKLHPQVVQDLPRLVPLKLLDRGEQFLHGLRPVLEARVCELGLQPGEHVRQVLQVFAVAHQPHGVLPGETLHH
jgi:hypothetical protein